MAENESTTNGPAKSIIRICVLFALWPLFLVPLIIGLYKLEDFCEKMTRYSNMCFEKIGPRPQYEILNANSSWNIATIPLLCCFWFLVFPLFKARYKINIFANEFEEIRKDYMQKCEDESKYYLKKCEEERIADIEFRTRLQNILYPWHNNKVLLSKNELLLEVKWDIENSERIINDCKHVVENTTNIDTFFSRFNLLAEKYQCLIPYEGLIDFQGYTPTEAYNGVIAQKDCETELFISRYIACMVDSAESLKTERGKINRYKNSLETFRKHYDEISPENIDMIEYAFATLIGEQV